MREQLRQHFRFYLVASLFALLLRGVFLFWFPRVTSDSVIYGEIAENWLQHGVYGLSTALGIVPTCIRLPGYPAFLAGVFAVFGAENYHAVFVLQILADLGSCLVMADMARRVVSPRAARAAFLLAALCPFLANYAAAALTETLEIFFTALALDFAFAGIESLPSRQIRAWLGCGLATGAAILLRPDGGLLLIALGVYLSWLWFGAGTKQKEISRRFLLQAGLVVGCAALAPLLPWTLRNLRTMHEFQPLTTRYSNDQNEFVALGFNRWVNTWMADYVSVEDIYWAVPGAPIDVEKLPARAFDSQSQREETAQLIADYDRELHVTPALDARFAALAAERIHAAPLRYYARLPLVRIADMWLRPRTELLPSDTRWWEFNDDPRGSVLAVSLGVMGLLYVSLAFLGWIRGRFAIGIGLLLIFVILRSGFLGTLENPEPRYTLECYPVVILLATALFS